MPLDELCFGGKTALLFGSEAQLAPLGEESLCH